MAKKKKFVWGFPLSERGVKQIHVVRMQADEQTGMLDITYEEGLAVEKSMISMEVAQKIGLINFDRLKEIIK